MYGDMTDVAIKKVIAELQSVNIIAKHKGDDKLLIDVTDVTHEEAFRIGMRVENVIIYQYNDMINMPAVNTELSIPFTVEELQEIVY
jgi:hypothetical protein